MERVTNRRDARVPFAPFIPHIERWLAESGESITALERYINVAESSLARPFKGEYKTIGFNIADRIACRIGHGLGFWQSDPELYEIYQEVDLSEPKLPVIPAHLSPEYPCGHERSPENSAGDRRRHLECRKCRNQRHAASRRAARKSLSVVGEELAA